MSEPLFSRPPAGKKWAVDAEMMDRIEAEIAKAAMTRYGPELIRMAIEAATPVIGQRYAQAGADAAIAWIKKNPPKRNLRRNQRFIARDANGRIVSEIETSEPDELFHPNGSPVL
jgi:hypothetical protein